MWRVTDCGEFGWYCADEKIGAMYPMGIKDNFPSWEECQLCCDMLNQGVPRSDVAAFFGWPR